MHTQKHARAVQALGPLFIGLSLFGAQTAAAEVRTTFPPAVCRTAHPGTNGDGVIGTIFRNPDDYYLSHGTQTFMTSVQCPTVRRSVGTGGSKVTAALTVGRPITPNKPLTCEFASFNGFGMRIGSSTQTALGTSQSRPNGYTNSLQELFFNQVSGGASDYYDLRCDYQEPNGDPRIFGLRTSDNANPPSPPTGIVTTDVYPGSSCTNYYTAINGHRVNSTLGTTTSGVTDATYTAETGGGFVSCPIDSFWPTEHRAANIIISLKEASVGSQYIVVAQSATTALYVDSKSWSPTATGNQTHTFTLAQSSASDTQYTLDASLTSASKIFQYSFKK